MVEFILFLWGGEMIFDCLEVVLVCCCCWIFGIVGELSVDLDGIVFEYGKWFVKCDWEDGVCCVVVDIGKFFYCGVILGKFVCMFINDELSSFVYLLCVMVVV